MNETLIIILNLIVAVVAVGGVIYLVSVLRKTAGSLKKAILFITLGYTSIVIEHFFIAYLRRTNTPLDAEIWFMPLPLYTIGIVLILIGAYNLKKLFEEIREAGK